LWSRTVCCHVYGAEYLFRPRLDAGEALRAPRPHLAIRVSIEQTRQARFSRVVTVIRSIANSAA